MRLQEVGNRVGFPGREALIGFVGVLQFLDVTGGSGNAFSLQDGSSLFEAECIPLDGKAVVNGPHAM